MSGKSRHGKGKHSFQGKKRKDRLIPRVAAAQSPAAAPAGEPVPEVKVPEKPVPATATVAQYPDIFTELRRIGILAGIILAILIVLAVVLS